MIFFFVALVILVLFVERQSMKNSLSGTDYDYSTSSILAAPDEQFELITRLTNHSRRFIPFVRLEELLPSEMTVHVENAEFKARYAEGYRKHVSSVYLMPRGRLERRVPVSISTRGRYILPGANLAGGDFLGLKENKQNISLFREVVIYPKETDSDLAMSVIGGFLGDISVRRFIIEDPVITAGFREYTGREPMKNIAWSQSARSGRLMVRNFDYTTEPSATVILNVECGGDDAHELIEGCFSLAHTTCRILEEHRIKYDFFTNATTSGAFGVWSYIGEGLGHKHFITILEGLGRASYSSNETFSSVIKRADSRNNGIRPTIIITPLSEAETAEYLTERSSGQTIVVSAKQALTGQECLS